MIKYLMDKYLYDRISLIVIIEMVRYGGKHGLVGAIDGIECIGRERLRGVGECVLDVECLLVGQAE